ncbi:MAG: hypothetical protein IT534_08035 [Bauldia sp.]|nr:hypothetical protein [Bauldia sp.]
MPHASSDACRRRQGPQQRPGAAPQRLPRNAARAIRAASVLFAAGAAVLALGGAIAVAQPAGEAVADLGQLRLAYAPGAWLVEDTAAGMALTCLAEDCAGLVVDVRVVAGAPFCDTGVAHAAAAAAFPGATRVGANMHVVGELAVFLASASRGYDVENRSVAFACVNREGVRTEFVTRAAPGEPYPAFGAGTVFELLAGLSAPPAAIGEFVLGDLVIPYPADRWTEPEYAPEVPTLACLPPTCDWGAELAMEAQPIAPGAVCEAYAGGASGREPPPVTRIVNPAGIAFEVSRIDSMCRAWSPSQYVACGIHGNIRYILATDGGAGCYFGPVVSEAALLDLLNAIRPVTTP